VGEPGFVHTVPIRYGEVDMQGVVFNAHYLAYVDDAMDRWLRTLDAHFEQQGWDIMTVRAVVDWQGSATIGEDLEIAVGVTRWGNTSFDVGFAGAVGDRPVFVATLTYVGVALGTKTPMAPPPEVRALLDGSAPAPA
jgi:acyl-CoA thioester hydrolase